MKRKIWWLALRVGVTHAFALLGLTGALVAAFYYYHSNKDDWDANLKADTNGVIAAIESGADGEHAVMLKPDGTVIAGSTTTWTSTWRMAPERRARRRW